MLAVLLKKIRARKSNEKIKYSSTVYTYFCSQYFKQYFSSKALLGVSKMAMFTQKTLCACVCVFWNGSTEKYSILICSNFDWTFGTWLLLAIFWFSICVKISKKCNVSLKLCSNDVRSWIFFQSLMFCWHNYCRGKSSVQKISLKVVTVKKVLYIK